MKFLKWLFDMSCRHSGDIRRYEKGKISTKIFVIILLFALVGATVGIEYWCLQLFNDNLFYAILVLLFLLIPVAGATIEFCVFYSFVGFKTFFRGGVKKLAEEIKSNKNESNEETQIDKTNAKEIKPEILQTEKTQPTHERKSHFWLDLVVGILGAVLAGFTVLAIVLIATR